MATLTDAPLPSHEQLLGYQWPFSVEVAEHLMRKGYRLQAGA